MLALLLLSLFFTFVYLNLEFFVKLFFTLFIGYLVIVVLYLCYTIAILNKKTIKEQLKNIKVKMMDTKLRATKVS